MFTDLYLTLTNQIIDMANWIVFLMNAMYD